jgi:hypothetical protein
VAQSEQAPEPLVAPAAAINPVREPPKDTARRSPPLLAFCGARVMGQAALGLASRLIAGSSGRSPSQ